MIDIKYIITGLLFCAGCYVGYTFEHSRFETYKAEASANYTKLLEEKIAHDRANSQRVTELEKKRLEETDKLRADYEATIKNLRTEYTANGVYKGDSASYNSSAGENRDSGGLVCFSEADFYARVAESMAITKRADELAINYDTLLKVCKGE